MIQSWVVSKDNVGNSNEKKKKREEEMMGMLNKTEVVEKICDELGGMNKL